MTDAPNSQAQQLAIARSPSPVQVQEDANQKALIPQSSAQLAHTTGENQCVDTMSGPASHPQRILIGQADAAATVVAVDPETGTVAVAKAQSRCQYIVTEGGFHYREVEVQIIQATISRVQPLLHKQEQAALAGPGYEEVVQDTCREKCRELCFARINGRNGFTTVVVKRHLRDIRDTGWQLLKFRMFPLFSKYGREVWTYLQCLITLAILLYSSITFGLADKDERTIVDILLLAFSIPSHLLSILDLVITIYFQRCRLCCDCIHGNCTTVEENDEQTEDVGNCCDRCCKLCCKNKYADLVRLLLSEFLIYPIVICTMFQFILGIIRIDSGIDFKIGLKIAVFAGGILWKALFVYIIRLVVLIRTVQAIQKARGPGSTSGKWFQVRFVLHVFGQMVSQVIMITCIGGKMYYENRNFKLDDTVHVSPYLWYMIVGGLLIPFAGIFTFAIANFYTFQEYPIGLFLDLVSTMRSKSIGDAVEPKLTDDEAKQLADQFLEIHNTNCINKYGYVLQSPALVVLSFAYSAFLLAFAVCCYLAPGVSGGVEGVALGGSIGWAVFFWIGVVLVNIANVGVVLVTGIWVGIFVFVLTVIASVILLIIFCCILCVCLSSDNNN